MAIARNQNARKHHIPREVIERLYVVEGKSIAEIEAITGCSTIYREMVRLGIPRRDCRKQAAFVPTPQDICYAAGFFDGEGSINIKNPTRTSGYRLDVSAAQTAIEPLQWLKERWGGSVRPRKRTARRKTAWTWSITSQLALTFLKDVRPHLLVKGLQADIAIEFQSSKINGMRRTADVIKREQASRHRLLALRSAVERPG